MPNIEMKRPKPGRKSIIFWTVSGLALMLFGLVMILVYGAKVIEPPKAAADLLWLIVLLAFFGVVFIARGIAHKRAGMFWFSWLFLWCAAVVAVGDYAAALPFHVIWPAFILSPAVASAVTWLFFSAKAAYLKMIIFFGAIAVIFFLRTSGIPGINWWIIGGILVFAVGAMVFINAFTTKKGRWDDADNNKIDGKDNVKIQ